MTVAVIETERLKDFPPSSAEIAPRRLIGTDNVAALLVNVDAGQTIEPCRMSATVLYYVIEGEGSLQAESERSDLHTGSVALVPAGTVRSLSAVEAMRVLAVQVA